MRPSANEATVAVVHDVPPFTERRITVRLAPFSPRPLPLYLRLDSAYTTVPSESTCPPNA